MAGTYNFTLDQGATFKRTFTWKDENGTAVNLTGYTARMQARTSHGATTAALDLTSAGGDITLGGAAGTIAITITSAATAALTAPGTLVYDLELVDGSGVITRLLEGTIKVTPEVTR